MLTHGPSLGVQVPSKTLRGFFFNRKGKVLGSKLFSTMVYNIYIYGTQAMDRI
jgi:hypothetical protein